MGTATDAEAGADRHQKAAPSPVSWPVLTALRASKRPAPLWLGYMIAGIAVLSALVLASMVVQRAATAVAVVGSAVVFLFALRRISAVVLALIPVTFLSTEPLHSTLPWMIMTGVLALSVIVLFCIGSLRVRPPHLWIAALAAIVLLSYFLPAVQLPSDDQTMPNLISVISGLVVLTVCVAAPPRASTLLRVIMVTGAVAGIVALVQGDQLEGRLQGLGTNPNGLAVYLAAPIVISVGLTLRHRNPLWLVPGAACLPALLASQSREGFLAVLAGTAFLIVQGRSRAQKGLIIVVVAGVMLALSGDLNGLASIGAGSRSAAELTNDNLVRAQVAWFAAHVAIGHPLLGIGFGQFPAYAAANSGLGIYIATTNQYLLLAAETGLIALAAFMALLWRAFRGPCPGDLGLVRAVLVTLAVSMLFADVFESSLVALPLWACLGVLLARAPDLPSPGHPPALAEAPAERSSADDRQ